MKFSLGSAASSNEAGLQSRESRSGHFLAALYLTFNLSGCSRVFDFRGGGIRGEFDQYI